MTKKKITLNDYSFDVDLDFFDDVEFFELADRLDAEPKLHVDILKMAIGEDGYKAFADYFKKRDGKLKMSIVAEAVAKIFEASDPKDSASGSSKSNTQTN